MCVQLPPLLYTCMCFSSVGTLTKSIIIMARVRVRVRVRVSQGIGNATQVVGDTIDANIQYI